MYAQAAYAASKTVGVGFSIHVCICSSFLSGTALLPGLIHFMFIEWVVEKNGGGVSLKQERILYISHATAHNIVLDHPSTVD